jgi:hypothetical protein
MVAIMGYYDNLEEYKQRGIDYDLTACLEYSVYRIQTVLHEEDVEAYPLGSVHWIDYPAGNGMPHQPEPATSTPSDA